MKNESFFSLAFSLRNRHKKQLKMAAAKKKTTLKTKTVKGTTRSSSKNEEKEEEDVSKLTVKQLKSLLEKKKVPTDGLKKDLIARLKNCLLYTSPSPRD